MSTINETNRKETAPKKRGRPPKNAESRVEGKTRPRTRVPVSGRRDILAVLNKDPAYEYRFVTAKDERGVRVMNFLQGGWDFVEYSEDLGIGSDHVYNTENVGSIIRIPDGGGYYLYLMRIPQEWYKEDQANKEAELRASENAIKRERDADTDDGMYGKNKISTESLY